MYVYIYIFIYIYIHTHTHTHTHTHLSTYLSIYTHTHTHTHTHTQTHTHIDHLIINQVAHGNHGTTNVHLTTRHPDFGLILVGEEVVTLWPVLQLDTRRNGWGPDDTGFVTISLAYHRRRASFRKPIALSHGHVERGLRPLLNLRLERGTARDARLETPAEHGLDFLKDKHVGDHGASDDALVKVFMSLSDTALVQVVTQVPPGLHLCVCACVCVCVCGCVCVCVRKWL